MSVRALTLVALTLAYTARAASPEPVSLTSGWLVVLDVEDASSVFADNEAIAFPIIIDDKQVLLVGGLPGTTQVHVSGGNDVERLFFVMVGRAQTLVNAEFALTVQAQKPQLVPVRNLRQVVVGNSDVCDAAVSADGRLELNPLNPGMTTLVAWAGGSKKQHRFQMIVIVESNRVKRSVEDFDAVLTDPLEGNRVSMIAGERYLVPRGATKRFGVKDDAVVVASGEGTMVVLTAQRAGATRLVTWDAKGKVSSRFVVVHERSAPPPPVQDDASLRSGGGTSR